MADDVSWTVLRRSRPWTPGAAAGGDPFWANVILLALNENGADTTTTFIDASSYGHVLTAIGDCQWDTGVTPPAGLSSTALGDGTGDELRCADHAIFDWGTSDFTIECWFNSTDVTGTGVIGRYQSDFTPGWVFWISDSSGLAFAASSNGSTFDISALGANILGTVAANTWYHAAVTRSGDTWRGFLDGVQGFSFTSSAALVDRNQGPYWFNANSGAVMPGNIGSTRITKAARYTGNFTPPSLPLQTS